MNTQAAQEFICEMVAVAQELELNDSEFGTAMNMIGRMSEVFEVEESRVCEYKQEETREEQIGWL